MLPATELMENEECAADMKVDFDIKVSLLSSKSCCKAQHWDIGVILAAEMLVWFCGIRYDTHLIQENCNGNSDKELHSPAEK
eukprot:1220945-Amphidinium_carterae.1